MKVKVNRDLTTYNYLKNEDSNLPQGHELNVIGSYDPAGSNNVEDGNGMYIIPGQYLDYVGEDEPDGI
jgi:hypothetical protein